MDHQPDHLRSGLLVLLANRGWGAARREHRRRRAGDGQAQLGGQRGHLLAYAGVELLGSGREVHARSWRGAVVGMLPDKKQLTHDEWDRMFSSYYKGEKLES